jgi:multidrug efflux system membrane fusion protein
MPATQTSATHGPTDSRQSWPRFSLLCAIAAAVFNVIGAGCSDKKADASKQKKGASTGPIPVVIAQVIEKDMPVQLRAIGNVQPLSTVMIRSQVTGQLLKVHFEEGQFVKQGDVLFSIDQRPFAGALQQAKANLARDTAQRDNARAEFERTKKLYDSALVARDEFDKAEATFKSLEATLIADQSSISNATLNLEFTTIRAPISGRTGNLIAHEGNIIKAPDDQLVTINQIEPIYISFGVPEQFLPEIRKRQKEGPLVAEATYVNLETSPPQGKLTFIDNSVDPTTGMIQLKATFPNNDDTLWPGQFVQVTLQLSEQSRALVVPSQTIQNGQKGEFVFVVKPDQTVEMREVKSGLVVKGETVVLSGLKKGETVVIDGQMRLVPGVKVTPKPSLEGVTPTAFQATNP